MADAVTASVSVTFFTVCGVSARVMTAADAGRAPRAAAVDDAPRRGRGARRGDAGHVAPAVGAQRRRRDLAADAAVVVTVADDQVLRGLRRGEDLHPPGAAGRVALVRRAGHVDAAGLRLLADQDKVVRL